VRRANPIVRLAGAVMIVALVGVGGYALGYVTRDPPTPGASPSEPIARLTLEASPLFPGAATFEPPTYSCSANPFVPVLLTIRLPSSVPDSYVLYSNLAGSQDGGLHGSTTVVGHSFTKLDDGSWIVLDSDQSHLVCAMDGIGVHPFRLHDASGHLAVEATFTIEP
jgi:hypothetical protein